MRKLSGFIMILVMLVLAAPAVKTYAARKGFIEIKLEKDNFKKVFKIKKIYDRNTSGDYDGYHFVFANRLLTRGYYIYGTKDLEVDYNAKERLKIKVGDKWYKIKGKVKKISQTRDLGFYRFNTCKYKYGKLSKFRVNEAKGTVIYIKKSNLIGIEKKKYDNGMPYYRIKLKHPYDEYTSYEYKWNESTHKYKVLYYYFEVDSPWDL